VESSASIRVRCDALVFRRHWYAFNKEANKQNQTAARNALSERLRHHKKRGFDLLWVVTTALLLI